MTELEKKRNQGKLEMAKDIFKLMCQKHVNISVSLTDNEESADAKKRIGVAQLRENANFAFGAAEAFYSEFDKYKKK